METYLFILVAAYLAGSIPTAVIISKMRGDIDIRNYGDGNMGSRNVKHFLGWGAGLLVVGIDIGKGAAVILISKGFGIPVEWQLAYGVSAIIGHDFPLFARFKGGQGLATILGVLVVLLPIETLTGVAIFGLLYGMTRNFDLSAGLGVVVIIGATWVLTASFGFILYIILLFVSVLFKKILDWPRRKNIQNQGLAENQIEFQDDRTLHQHPH